MKVISVIALPFTRFSVAAVLIAGSPTAHAQSIIMSEPARVTLQSSSTEAGHVVLTADVATTTGGGVPGGTIQFLDETTMVVLGWANVATPSIVVDQFATGLHRVRADYSGTSDFLPLVVQSAQSAALVIHVKHAPDVAVSSSDNPSIPGQLVTLTAMVSGHDAAINGAVTFRDGTQVLAAHIGLDHAGNASFTTSALADGSRAITVEYEGDSAYIRTTSACLVQDVGAIRMRSSQRSD